MFYIYAGGESIYKPLDDQLVLFSPKLTLEIGKAGSLEFDIPPQNPFYDRMNQLSTEVSVDMDSDEIFHGRVLSNERGFNNVRHIYCEGDLSYLVDSVQKGVQYSGTTHDLFNRIISAHNARVDANKRFTVGTVNIENRSVVLVGHSEGENLNTGTIDYKQIAIDSIVDEWNNSFDYIQTCLIDYCGGYLRTRRENGVIYIDLLQDFGNRAIQPIELGSNLLDLTEEITAEDVFTVLIPLGDDNLTIASVNGGSDEIVDTAAVARFGRIVKTHVFNNVSSASTLLENAQRFMATNVNVPRTITVRAVDLHLLNKLISPIRIGDKVKIYSTAHDVNDELTCTKIDYDLENPQNNNYTFGNPKQTLTQRYREDIRMSNDTYGNSASPSSPSAASPSAASAKGAAAAAAAAKKADKEKDKALKDFYDAWINVDPEQGHVDLGALYKKYIDGKEVLISQCGIDLDGKTGNVNIQSLHNVVDDHGHLIAENEAYIKMVETDTAVELQHVAERHDHLAGVEAEHYTAITQRADSLGSSIDLLARDVNEFEDNTTTALADINIRADDLESRISSSTEFINSVDAKADGIAATESKHWTSITQTSNDHESRISSVTGAVNNLDTREANHYSAIVQVSNDHADAIKIVAQRSTNNETNIASITATVTDQGSQINLKADKTYVDGLLEAERAKFDSLTTGRTTASSIRVTSLLAGSISIRAGSDSTAYAVTTTAHSHELDITEKDSGNVEISIGAATSTYPQKKSFNIANTKYYKDGVAAVSIKSLERESYSTTGDYSVSLDNSYVRYDTAKKEIVGRIRITLGNNTTKSTVVRMAGNRAYDAGAQTAVVSSVTVGAVGTPSYSSEDKAYYATASITAKAQGTKSDGTKYTSADYTKNVSINVTNAYNAGKKAVGIKSVTKNSYSTTGDFSVTFDDGYVRRNNSGQIVGRAEIQLDGSDVKKNVVIYMAGDKAYNAGKNDVTISTSVSASSTSANNKVLISSSASASNGKTASGSSNLFLSFSDNTSSKVRAVIKDSNNKELAYWQITPKTSVASLGRSTYFPDYSENVWKITLYAYDSDGKELKKQDVSVQDIVDAASGSGDSYYYWSDEKTGPYGSKQRDCYFVIDGNIVHTAKVIWSSGNPTFQ